MNIIRSGKLELLNYTAEDFVKDKNIRIFTNNHIEIEYDNFTFSGGEEHVRVFGSLKKHVYIVAKIKTSSDLMKLLLITDALRRMNKKIDSLYLTYIPYARQDRVCNEGESLSVKVFADIINSQNYKEVVVFDPHSDVSTALLNNVKILKQCDIAKNIFNGTISQKFDYIISPDAGSMKKCSELGKLVYRDVIVAEKVRDIKTGKILKTVVNTEKNLTGTSVIIVDDICDGGMTFIELAKVLKEKGVSFIGLYVTHGIFSKGFEVFGGLIDHIYTTNTFYTIKGNEPKQLTVIDVI